jgi:hypothetical protein
MICVVLIGKALESDILLNSNEKNNLLSFEIIETGSFNNTPNWVSDKTSPIRIVPLLR